MVSVFEIKVSRGYTKTLYIVGTESETNFILSSFPNYEKVKVELERDLNEEIIEQLESFVGTGHPKYIFLYDMTDTFPVDYFKKHCRSIDNIGSIGSVEYRDWKIANLLS